MCRLAGTILMWGEPSRPWCAQLTSRFYELRHRTTVRRQSASHGLEDSFPSGADDLGQVLDSSDRSLRAWGEDLLPAVVLDHERQNETAGVPTLQEVSLFHDHLCRTIVNLPAGPVVTPLPVFYTVAWTSGACLLSTPSSFAMIPV